MVSSMPAYSEGSGFGSLEEVVQGRAAHPLKLFDLIAP